MHNELISVIVPVYNVKDYLYDCVDSIINQTYINLEIILVDDGSDDGSESICDYYRDKDKRVVVIHKDNKGLSDARNCGIYASHGKFIALVDSDDVIEEEFIKTLYEVQKKTDSDLVCCEMVCFYDQDIKRLYNYWQKRRSLKNCFRVYQPKEIIELSFYQHVSITGAPQKLYRRRLFDEVIFPVGRYFEDLATTYKFFQRANSISVINKKLYGYRMRSTSIMNHEFNVRKLDCMWVAESLYNDISSTMNEIKNSSVCASFRVNRLVFDQIPFREKEYKHQVWKAIRKYGCGVMRDRKVKKHERLLAFFSYFGMYIFTFVLKIFRMMRAIKYRTEL